MKKEEIKIYYALMVVLVVLIGVCAFFFNYFYNMRDEKLALSDVSIKETSDMSSNVKLLSTNILSSTENENAYLLSLIDNVSTHFNYDVTFSSNVTGDYSYYIIGYVAMNDGINTIKNDLYKSDMFKENIDGSVINISNTFDIDLDSYLKEINNLTTSNLSSEITFDVIINYSVVSDDISKNISKTDTLSVSIPLTEITSVNLSDNIDNTRRESNEDNFKDNKVYIIVCLEFMGSIIIFLLLIVLIYKRLFCEYTPYEKVLNNILNNYSNLIVYLKDLPYLDEQNVLFVESMDDLVASSNTTQGPINYFEIVKGKESIFMVIDDSTSYVYKLSSKNIKK